ELDGAAQYQLPDRPEHAGSEPGTGAPPVQPGADAAQEPAAPGRYAGAGRRAAGADEPEAGRGDARVAAARRTAAGGRGEEVHGRHVDELLRLPGAARSVAGARERAARDCRLQPFAR